MQDQQREILSQVAAGQITAAEGAARLEALDSAPAAVAGPPPPTQSATPTAARLVNVSCVFASADVVGDPSVDFAVADGPHRAHIDGDTLFIEQSPLGHSNSFSFGDARQVITSLGPQHRDLTVRMNPKLALRVKVQAGNVRVEGVHGPITADVQAGNCEVSDLRGPVNLSTRAGNINAGGRLELGASKIRCQMGEVKLNLEKGSNVRITARTTMGDVAIEGSGATPTPGKGGAEVIVGSGVATLECDCTMGSIRVYAD